jgi:hypothetical protein
MAAALIGNIMISNIRTSISATTASGVTSGANQVLANNILANPTLGSGNYTYQWSQSGTAITFTAATSNSTNCTYGSLSVSGSTTIFCTVTDTWTGVKSVTANCVITWPVQTITQNIVISGSPTYNGSGQAYTLTPSTGPAPTGSPASFTNAGTYTYPTNITSITPSAGYVIGTVTGSFTINKATISGTAANPSATYNAGSQSGTVITGVLPNVAPNIATFSGSVTASGTNAGTYTSSITGTGNYQGTVPGGTFTISKVNLVFSNFGGFNCGGYEVLQSTITVSGFVGGEYGLLTIYTGTGVTAGAVAGVSGSDGAGSNVNKVSQVTGANPIALGNVSGYTGMYLTRSDGLVFFAQISGGGVGSVAANYNSTYAPNPLENDCGGG